MKHLLLLRVVIFHNPQRIQKKQTVLAPYNAQYYKVINTARSQLTRLQVLCWWCVSFIWIFTALL